VIQVGGHTVSWSGTVVVVVLCGPYQWPRRRLGARNRRRPTHQTEQIG